MIRTAVYHHSTISGARALSTASAESTTSFINAWSGRHGYAFQFIGCPSYFLRSANPFSATGYAAYTGGTSVLSIPPYSSIYNTACMGTTRPATTSNATKHIPRKAGRLKRLFILLFFGQWKLAIKTLLGDPLHSL